MMVERLNPQCITCLLNKHLKNVPESFSKAEALNYMQGILKVVANADIRMSAPEIVEQINKFKASFGETFDFSEIKRYFNGLLLSLEEEIGALIERSENPLKTAVKYAIAGNFIDFGAMKNVSESELKEKLQNANNIKVSESEFESFKNELLSTKKLVYLTDNCGEIVLDKLLIKQILKLNENICINVIVCGKPVLNDCTMEDAKQVGLDKLVSVLDNGTAVAGTCLEKISSNSKELIDNADVIISKGQGNF